MKNGHKWSGLESPGRCTRKVLEIRRKPLSALCMHDVIITVVFRHCCVSMHDFGNQKCYGNVRVFCSGCQWWSPCYRFHVIPPGHERACERCVSFLITGGDSIVSCRDNRTSFTCNEMSCFMLRPHLLIIAICNCAIVSVSFHAPIVSCNYSPSLR